MNRLSGRCEKGEKKLKKERNEHTSLLVCTERAHFALYIWPISWK